METGLKDRVAIVAASSQGIGKATALAFAAGVLYEAQPLAGEV